VENVLGPAVARAVTSLSSGNWKSD
jgi:hypothetical protein